MLNALGSGVGGDLQSSPDAWKPVQLTFYRYSMTAHMEFGPFCDVCESNMEAAPPLCAIVKETEGECLHPRCFCFTFAIIYSQIALQGNVPFSYFTPPFLINEPSLQ